jgi:hypothetical protein
MWKPRGGTGDYRKGIDSRLAEGLATHFGEARPCPKCGAAPDALSWFYFRSPKETWPELCGVEGWMAVCDRRHIQVNFFIEAIS